jgi:hypothetical protein
MGRISVNAETASFSAGMEVDPALWDAKACRVRGNSRPAVETNRRIGELTERITLYHREILDEQGYITAELVKNAVTGVGRRKENLLELFREHNDEYAAQLGVTRAERSIRSYRAVYKQVERFLETHYGVVDIPLRQLDHSFIERFDSFLRTEQGLAASTVSAKKRTNFAGETERKTGVLCGAGLIRVCRSRKLPLPFTNRKRQRISSGTSSQPFVILPFRVFPILRRM